MRTYTENVCPNCGNIVLIYDDKKVDVCMACGEFVGNSGWIGYRDGRSHFGCFHIFIIILFLLMLPIALIGCLTGV